MALIISSQTFGIRCSESCVVGGCWALRKTEMIRLSLRQQHRQRCLVETLQGLKSCPFPFELNNHMKTLAGLASRPFIHTLHGVNHSVA